MKYFLAKTDPETYSLDDLERERKTAWDGVTNPQAVRAIREMKPNDRIFIYHSGGADQTSRNQAIQKVRRLGAGAAGPALHDGGTRKVRGVDAGSVSGS